MLSFLRSCCLFDPCMRPLLCSLQLVDTCAIQLMCALIVCVGITCLTLSSFRVVFLPVFITPQYVVGTSISVGGMNEHLK